MASNLMKTTTEATRLLQQLGFTIPHKMGERADKNVVLVERIPSLIEFLPDLIPGISACDTMATPLGLESRRAEKELTKRKKRKKKLPEIEPKKESPYFDCMQKVLDLREKESAWRKKRKQQTIGKILRRRHIAKLVSNVSFPKGGRENMRTEKDKDTNTEETTSRRSKSKVLPTTSSPPQPEGDNSGRLSPTNGTVMSSAMKRIRSLVGTPAVTSTSSQPVLTHAVVVVVESSLQGQVVETVRSNESLFTHIVHTNSGEIELSTSTSEPQE
uniref:Uncharacterized protein n=1 Tax=Grammatophora oceanica TaxID=210454 RepID=A0A7S1V006_9STRA|mmetsp:Transcript_31604/g.46871  ORF Transcript_31604/g.46871 Transcript_31604/m.46871 type:complete len:272 (+) Transcript_31604:316-1131(+)|eukprot:CAMPEP_0194035690 /NCGR_PEP_ID=MMETSP0009_2-20130614/8107_1 /TAXON_ID=210454 /ORGANISM="Grammatophora oceanica, Strain CCMP 410" /LENGTH=271 /DNA_ID=CAMNT_0038677145 /DNA_START=283 /DNA_END=1098 /DNA_ORIENTATION=+